ncbi:MAG: cyclic pyranopterin monophosphate synthase MoaC [Acidimicrobiales bacterium]|jgi:cyclic pyranopterin phosphate synthase
MEQRSTHVDSAGKLRMVDVSRKRPSKRQALASCVVTTVADVSTLGLSRNGVDPLHAARLAGIQGAKQTSNLIPLCHPLNVDQIHVEVVVRPGQIAISATVGATHRTGVEMEALTACAIAALSIVGSLRRVDPNAQIDDLVLLRKTGGKSGDWGRLVDDSH